MKQEDTIVVCVLWGEQSVPSYRKICCKCKAHIAASKFVIDNGGYPHEAKYMCLECMVKEVEADDDQADR